MGRCYGAMKQDMTPLVGLWCHYLVMVPWITVEEGYGTMSRYMVPSSYGAMALVGVYGTMVGVVP